MISERRFASEYSAFWRELLPFGERFVRSTNHQLTRFGKKISSELEVTGRALAAESCFAAVVEALTESRSSFDESQLKKAVEEAASSLSRFPDFHTPETISTQLLSEVQEMGKATLTYLKKVLTDTDTIIPRPVFLGYGILDQAEGDLLIDDCLVEFKTVTRSFRSTDYRQVLTYLALNQASPVAVINKIMLLNPRQCHAITLEAGELAEWLSARTLPDILSSIQEFATVDSGSGQ